MEKTNLEDWLTVREASEVSGYATEYIRQLIRDGDIDAEKKGFSWLVNRESLEKYKDKKTQVN
jgi:excisionase family DNA binding protein